MIFIRVAGDNRRLPATNDSPASIIQGHPILQTVHLFLEKPEFTQSLLINTDTQLRPENALTRLCTYTPKIFVKKFNISVDYFQCEKFIVIFFYCHTKIQTCISEKIERKKCKFHDTDS